MTGLEPDDERGEGREAGDPAGHHRRWPTGGWFEPGGRAGIGPARQDREPPDGGDDWIWSDHVRLPALREVTAPTDGHRVRTTVAEEEAIAADTADSPGAAPPSETAGDRGTSEQARPRFAPGTQTLDAVEGTWNWGARPPAAWQTPQRGHYRFLPPAAPGTPPAGIHRGPAWPAVAGSPYRPPEVDVTRGEHQPHWATVPLHTLVMTLVFLALPGVALLGVVGLQRVFALTLIVFSCAGAYSLAAWWMTRFMLRADHLIVRSGLLHRTVQEVPLSRLQAVDVVRPLFLQILGLAELRVELAGGDRGEVRLRYLSRRVAERLRASLLAHAAGLPGQAPEAPERPFYRLSFWLLLGALAFRLPVLGAFVLFLLLIVVGLAFFEPGVLGGAIPLLLGLMRGFLGPLTRYTDFSATLSPDGLRLRYGFIQRRTQTVPPGRVQAVRIVEPLLWRSLGVVRLEANVAGYVGERQMDSSTLLPVVDRSTAFLLVNQLFPGTDAGRVRLVPARKGWFAGEALGVDDSVFVVRRGLFSRVIEIIPHARIQSIRLTAGPLSRWLGVATVEADTPPGPVQARAPGRDPVEARRIVEGVSARAYAARRDTAGPERWATRSDAPREGL